MAEDDFVEVMQKPQISDSVEPNLSTTRKGRCKIDVAMNNKRQERRWQCSSCDTLQGIILDKTTLQINVKRIKLVFRNGIVEQICHRCGYLNILNLSGEK